MLLLRLTLCLSVNIAVGFFIARDSVCALANFGFLEMGNHRGSTLSAKYPERRAFVGGIITTSILPLVASVPSAEAVGPVKIPLKVKSYSAKPCPKVGEGEVGAVRNGASGVRGVV